nr:DUF192 domain-containing protein [Mesobacterium pallidum]
MGSAAAAACREDTLRLRGDFGEALFRVEIADDAAERAQGLMHRESLPRGAGMLFLYPFPRQASFWMRNTLIPLDMIFIDRTGTVTRVHSNAIPLDETAIDGGPNVLAVLEINGGMAAPMGLAPGVQIQHPLMPQGPAVWPCEP